MVKRDAETFVALARAVALAHAEGAVDDTAAADLTAALVAGMLTGCMEMETYGKVHDALAQLLEKAFEGPARQVSAVGDESGQAEPLGVYLEVVGDAWDKVAVDNAPGGTIEAFLRQVFDLKKARFGDDSWFRAPLRADFDALLRAARAAGLLVISAEGTPPARAEGALRDLSSAPSAARVVFGWGERRTALDLAALKGRQ